MQQAYINHCIERHNEIIARAKNALRNNAKKVVILVDIEGRIIGRYDSATEAGKAMKVDKTNAAFKAQKQTLDRKGRLWLYAEDVKYMTGRQRKALYRCKLEARMEAYRQSGRTIKARREAACTSL